VGFRRRFAQPPFLLGRVWRRRLVRAGLPAGPGPAEGAGPPASAFTPARGLERRSGFSVTGLNPKRAEGGGGNNTISRKCALILCHIYNFT
ncbi:hypothetical protein Nmel_007930, partial [Mimus melanotis]